ncbi:hypothetical protein GCM10027168_41450 [Streptomyces capparidis]
MLEGPVALVQCAWPTAGEYCSSRIPTLHQWGSDGRLTCEPCPWEFDAPADRVTARPGQDYTAVPTRRSPAALRQARTRRHRRGTRPAAGGGARPAPPPPAAVTAAAAGNAPPPPPAPPPPAPPGVRAAEAPWRLEILPGPADHPGVRQLLHRAGCWAAARTTTPLTDTEQARLRGQAHVGLCDTCAGDISPGNRAGGEGPRRRSICS